MCLKFGFVTTVAGQTITSSQHTEKEMGNPIIPGYFADPTIKKIDDTYYLYATTDGNGGGLGPSQVWTSKDFVNWTIQPMNWPDTHWYWAPDMTQGYDGRYYLYYSQPVQLYGAVSDTPVGPWTPLQHEGEALVPNYKIPGVITLDGQTFTDDDGKIYMYWGTWGIYPDHGCAVGLLNPDMKTFAEIKLIPNTDAKDFFEAPLVFKRNGIYYFMYSSGHCEDHTYRVQYATSTVGPMGPFEYKEAFNPVLSTTIDGTVHGPGHHSVLQEGDQYYIVYHRHNNPHSGGGFHRQIAADKMEFDAEGNIVKVVPTHTGIGLLAKNTLPYTNHALHAAVEASSSYSDDFRPTFAIDDNNGTLWKAKDNMNPAWLKLDLGEQKVIKTILTQFEYPTWYYGYLIEYSNDGKDWHIFSDRRANQQWGSPMVDKGNVEARYLRITIDKTQVEGLFRALWNIKVFSEDINQSTVLSSTQDAVISDRQSGLLIDFEADGLSLGNLTSPVANKGSLIGQWTTEGSPYVTLLKGRQAVILDGRSALHSTFTVPTTLAGNSSHTVAMWVLNPTIERHEPLLTWTQGTQDLTRAVFGYGHDRNNGAIVRGAWPDVAFKELPTANMWHHMVVSFDGYMERVYVDGIEVNAANKMLFMRIASAFSIGKAGNDAGFFSGAISSLKVYDKALSPGEIETLYKQTSNAKIGLWHRADQLTLGEMKEWPNEGVKQGSLLVKEGMARTKVVGHKIAVVGEPSASLETIALTSMFSEEEDTRLDLEFQALDNKFALLNYPAMRQKIKVGEWHKLTLSRRAKGGQVLLDGVPVALDLKSIEKDFINMSTGVIKLNHVAIASLFVSHSDTFIPLNEPSSWTNERTTFFVQPRFINANKIFMQAKSHPGEGVQYLFIADGEKTGSGWQDSPNYLVNWDNVSALPHFRILAKDRYGNVADMASAVATVKNYRIKELVGIDERFNLLTEDNVGQWNLFSGDSARVKEALIQNGGIRLSSADTRWDGREQSGPFLSKEVSGDFVFEVELANVNGQTERKGSANESGILVHVGPEQRKIIALQNSVMTGWGVGNMATRIDGGYKMQQNTGAGWNFHRYLQVQRVGDQFFLRTSKDGNVWQELPGSPFDMSLNQPGAVVRVGVYQSTNDNKDGFADFKRIRISQ
ncbi:Concanavalin A-like lectin/glucanases superfamily protein [Sphingobacterium psychroaquaticum]|uniref:Concanavalin A-like lectin/glucanases superfamily protein n=2 Tax=Sphingobacterium psychroaquaticum TaxID=561061 RepID=A0A1X7I436_9SPHI|nr:Concanavalin A-like lectin/glucanases superfamily protein [Sphingobacterium psychroaquaticum]